MKLFNTNILIYAAKPEFSYLRPLFTEPNIYVSDITRIETLGFHKITPSEKEYFEAVFDIVPAISISESIVQKAIVLKQAKKMSVGDAITAATALLHNLTLITVNTKDFSHIPDLVVKNPRI